MIVFPFSGAGFANTPSTFLISYEIQTRYSKIIICFEQYIWDHLQGTKTRICILRILHCLVQPSQFIHFLFHIIFIIRIRLWIFQTVNLYFVCLCMQNAIKPGLYYWINLIRLIWLVFCIRFFGEKIWWKSYLYIQNKEAY